MKKYTILLVIPLLAFTACQKVVDADNLLDTEERVSITSYISPQDTVLRVSVTRALPSIGTPLSVSDSEANKEKFLIRNAQVSISNEAGDATSLSYSEENLAYLADASSLAIRTDQSYFLQVVVDGNEYNASCTIPGKVADIQEQINFRDDSFGGKEAIINISFEDIQGEKNYYVLGGIVNTTIQVEGEEEPQTFEFSLFFDTDQFLSDNLEDGGTLSGKAITYAGSDIEIRETQVTLQVANVEEALFQNLRTTATNQDADGNPFVEYAIAPNTILDEGAVGVFAGYNLTEKTIDIELE